MAEIGGYHEDIDWPKLGPSLLIASCLIVAIRTAKRPPVVASHTYDTLYKGLDPTDTPMLLRDMGTDDIYALTLESK